MNVLEVSLAFDLLKHLKSGLCWVALSGYCHELSPDLISSAGSTGVTGQDCKGSCWTEMQMLNGDADVLLPSYRRQRSAIFACSHQ